MFVVSVTKILTKNMANPAGNWSPVTSEARGQFPPLIDECVAGVRFPIEHFLWVNMEQWP